MTYKTEMDSLLKKYGSANALYCSKEYKLKYPKLKKMYEEEGLREKRKKLLKSRRELKKMGFEAMCAVR